LKVQKEDKMVKMSKRAKQFIAKSIRKERRKGTPKRKSIAIAFSKARRRGFKVPRR